ncbi:ABC transporter permease [Candidatus Saccharibacteria bacterium]|nr:ABC transporter permease [Candidatus Saccharibacteria bacterium]
MALLLRTHYELAKSSLKRNRTRSFLTCLGISIGIAAIILILSLVGSISSLVSEQVSKVGSSLIVVRPTSTRSTVDSIVSELTTSTQYLKSNLTLKDVDTISKIEGVAAVSPLAISVNSIQGDTETVVSSATVVGTNPDFLKIQNLSLKNGTFINENAETPNAVIGTKLANSLFGTAEPIGKTITLLGQRFIIIGVLAETDDPINFNNIDLDDAFFVCASALNKIDNSLQIQQINIRTENTDTLTETANKIREALVASKSGDTNFAVLSGDEITHPAGSLLSIISGILAIVAGISLIVGGIGVMNIMLVSVAERTHEIGVRKAIGASTGNIMLQFLIEALILSIIGGFMGLILGYGLSFLLCLITPFNPYISWQILAITFGVSLLTGLIFGLYPALKAAHKNPIYSLKFWA